MGLAGDHRRLLGFLGRRDGLVDLVRVVTIDFQHLPTRRAEAFDLIGLVRKRNLAVDGDVIVVPEDDQLAQGMPPGQADRLMADALHQAAVAGDDIGVVIDELAAVTRAQDLFGHGETHGVRNALTQRAGGGLDPVMQEVFRVARRPCAPLAEVLDLIQLHAVVTGQMQQRIEQHRAVARRQDKPVAVRPVGRSGIELQVFLKEDRGHIGHAHRHPGMAGIGGMNGIKGQRADGGGLVPVVGIGLAQGSDVHGAFSFGSGNR